MEPTFTATPSTETVPDTDLRGLGESQAGKPMMTELANRTKWLVCRRQLQKATGRRWLREESATRFERNSMSTAFV